MFNLIDEKLRYQKRLFQSLVEQSSDMIIFVNREGIVTYQNPAVEISLGLKVEEMIGSKIFEHLHPDDLKFTIDAFHNLLNKLPKDINAPVQQIRLRHRNGSWRTFEVVESKLVHSNFIEFVMINLRDITERKKADKLWHQNENKYRTILEDIQEGYSEIDLAGNFTFFNNSVCRFFGYSKEELMGMNYRQCTYKEDVKRIFQMFNKIYRTGEPTEVFGWQIIRKDGTKRYIESSISLQKDSSGKPTGFRGILRDVTDHKRTEGKLLLTLENLRESFKTTIQVLASAIESRDRYTAGHQLRVADLARTIATEMKLPHETIEGIRLAGSIHDVGKLSIPAEILSKPTKLTDIEFSLIKEHAQSGYKILKNVESPWPLAQIVYQHHERMNGFGYPRNLKGDKILLEARIMAVADVMEAMASYRPYRPTLGIEAALEEIGKNKGVLYDDTVADACLKLFREKGYQLK